MLNTDALQQLSQLKNDIRSTKEFAQGTVRGTTKRFGFVDLDDGRSAFLNPNEMQRVFPGDRVEVSIESNKDDKLEATLENLLQSDLSRFTGRYVVRGQGHFVDPDLPQFSRLLFLPPKERKGLSEGDHLQCKVTQHPFKHAGKTQASVLQRIGDDSCVGIERDYTIAKFELPNQWPNEVTEQANDIGSEVTDRQSQYQDLTADTFVTIDAATTQDMDDALSIRVTDSGWLLRVAIADPSHDIAFDSALEQHARQRCNTVYLPGSAVTMLPETLSHTTYSLRPGVVRPAVVSDLHIDSNGAITEHSVHLAYIQSSAKLSYAGVSAALDDSATETAATTANTDSNDTDNITPELLTLLQHLQQCAQARNQYRRDQHLVMEDKPDYDFVLNEQGKISDIIKTERNVAHKIVEEAMLATNHCAGQLLAQHNCGLFSQHAGFKTERLEEIASLLKDDQPDTQVGNLQTLTDYQRLMSDLALESSANVTLSTLKRMLQPGKLSTEALPHMGLGFSHYATITSPIRRYNDLYNHYCLKHIVTEQALPPLPENTLEQLQEQIFTGRKACRQMEQWLCSEYMATLPKLHYQATVVLVTASGLGVTLTDNGINGFVFLGGNKKQKPAFDSRRMKLTVQDTEYVLDQTVTVVVDNIDEAQRKVNFVLVSDQSKTRQETINLDTTNLDTKSQSTTTQDNTTSNDTATE